MTPIAIPADKDHRVKSAHLKQLQQPFMVYQLDATAYQGDRGSAVYRQYNGEVVAITLI